MKKKFLAIGLALAMAFMFTACGSDGLSYSNYDLEKYIELGQYKELTVQPYTVSVSSDEVDADIDETLEGAATDEEIEKGKKVKDGDTLNIDYVGKINGKAFDNGSAEGASLEIGSGQFIDGFESGLIDKKIGETVELNLTFPENYGAEDLAGKDVVFTVKINSGTRKVAPSIEEYVKSSDDYKTVDEMKAAVKKKLKNTKEETAIEDQKKSLWSDVLDSTKALDYPEKEVSEYIELNSKQIDTVASQYGTTREAILNQYGFESEDDFAKVNDDSSKLRVKQEMMVEMIAANEGITYTDAEAEELLQNMKSQGYTEETILAQTGRDADSYVRIELLYEKVLDFLLDNAKIEGSAKEY